MSDIRNKIIVIAGTSTGISMGEAAARYLASLGACVVLGANCVNSIEAIADEINVSGQMAMAIPTDIASKKSLQNLIDSAVDMFGRIDILVNHAGLIPHPILQQTNIDEWGNIFDVHIKGILNGISSVLPYMKKQKSGHIINAAYLAAHNSSPTSAIHSVAKHAIQSITQHLKQEVTPNNIRSSLICADTLSSKLRTAITDENTPSFKQAYLEQMDHSDLSYAQMLAYLINQPVFADVNEVTFRSALHQ